MNDETTIATVEQSPEPPANISVHGNEVSITATSPDEMTQGHAALLAWTTNKVREMEAEAKELVEAYEEAKKQKWKTVTLKRHSELAVKRVDFYRRIKTALEHGLIIVPHFPVELFAVRTDKAEPTRMGIRLYGKQTFTESAPGLVAGEGQYQNPFPEVVHVELTEAEKKRARENNQWADTTCWPVGWDKMEFPTVMAKPEIMRATDRAMQLKIFDEIGILLPQAQGTGSRKGDPIITASIIDPRKNGRRVTFIIAWHLDTRTI